MATKLIAERKPTNILPATMTDDSSHRQASESVAQQIEQYADCMNSAIAQNKIDKVFQPGLPTTQDLHIAIHSEVFI
jgi:hypothetical protein